MRRNVLILICITTFYCCNIKKEITFYEDGNIKEEGKTLKNVKVGKWRHYYFNGALLKTGRYNSKGKVVGIWKEWNFEGQLKYKARYKEGATTTWELYQNGVIKEKGKFGKGCSYLFLDNELKENKNDPVKIGSWKEFNFDSTGKGRENYIPIFMTYTLGLEVHYSDETGEKISVNDTIMDQYYMIYDTIVEWHHLKDGKWQYWNGITTGDINFQKGCEFVYLKDGLQCKNSASVKTGIWKEFHEDGSLKGRGKYYPILITYEFPRITNHSLDYGKELSEKDLLTGNYFEVYDTLFVDNYLKDGVWKYWNEDKKLISKEYYNKGQLVKKKKN